MRKGIYFVLAFSAFIWGCVSSIDCKKISTSGKGQPPVILASYAATEARPGRAWRVYIRAEDPDGDMVQMIQVIGRGGGVGSSVGPFSTTFPPLRAEHSAAMNGYFFLNLPPATQADYQGKGSMGLTLRMSIRDCQNNESEAILFPLRFTPRASPNLPPEWQEADKNSLGAIKFDLRKYLGPGRGTQ